jgi:hypothetical protein
MPLQLLASLPGLLIGESGPLLVTVSTRSPDNERFNFLMDQQEAAIQRHGQASFLTVLPAFDGPMKADASLVKARMQRMDQLASQILGSAMVVTVTGLQGAMVRMILTASLMLQSGRSPTRIFGAIPEALAWLQGLPGQDAGVKARVSLVADVTEFVNGVK